MNIVTSILSFIDLFIFLYLCFAAFYVFLFAFAGLFRTPLSYKVEAMKKIAVLIPAYKEDEVIIEVAKKATQQNYSEASYDVVVIADSLKSSTLEFLRSLPIKLVEVSFEKSTKSKALKAALNKLEATYDIAVILDADNIMELDFLQKINGAFQKNIKVVQGRRVAKNHNTSFAILDGISEAVNNHIFRQGHRALGLSSGLIGSGMAFDYQLFKNLMMKVNAVGGFDKELEFRLFQDNYKIEYLKNAIVFDEKIQNTSDFTNQRRRWLSTKSVYLRKFLVPGIKALLKNGNLDIIDKLYQMVMPPRVLMLGGIIMISVLHWIKDMLIDDFSLLIPSYYWYSILGLTVFTFIISIPRAYHNTNTLKACLSIPRAFTIMFSLLFKLKGANKEFIHTKHTSVNS